MTDVVIADMNSEGHVSDVLSRGGGPESGTGSMAKIFDPSWYVQNYGLGNLDDDEAWRHFVDVGFALDWSPSPLVATSFVRERLFPHVAIASAGELLAALSRVPADARVGWSPRIMPAWVSMQLGLSPSAAASRTFASLLGEKLSLPRLSPHPGLRLTKCHPSWTTVAHALCELVRGEAISAASRVDLAEYRAQHRDLRDAQLSTEDCFDHLWTVGFRQNRLKFLGVSAPQRMEGEQCQRYLLLMLMRDALRGRVMDEDAVQSFPPKGPVALLVDRTGDLDAALRYDPRKLEEPPQLEVLFALSQAADSGAFQLLRRNGPEPVGAPELLLRPEILDRDLLDGSVREHSERVVYSINIGAYDEVPVPPQLDGCVHYLITDLRRLPAGSPWRVVRPTLSERDRKRLCLWYKTHPHRLFPNARHSVWMDANIECLPGSEKVIAAQEVLAEVATFVHPDRSCIYEEAEEIIRLGLDDPTRVTAVVTKLREAGFPERNGLFETSVLYAKPNDYAIAQFFDCWWRNIFFGSRRDQMSFTYAAFLTGVEISPLDGRHSAKTSRFFRKSSHRRPEGRLI